MRLTGTHFNYYFVCKRKLWLFVNGMSMEHTSNLVFEGKVLHETSYPQRSGRYEELEIDGIKIDFYDTRNKVIHEIKKSDKMEIAHEWQVKYYIYVLEKNGIQDVSGLLEYPSMRQTKRVLMNEYDRPQLMKIEEEIRLISYEDVCPPIINSRVCKLCSYGDFCYAKEL